MEEPYCFWRKLDFQNYRRQPFREKKSKLRIDLKWREMWSKVIFGHPKCPPAVILWNKKLRIDQNVKKKVAYWSEMVRNAIESDFRSSKMGGGGGITMASLACKPFGNIPEELLWKYTQNLPLDKYTNSSLHWLNPPSPRGYTCICAWIIYRLSFHDSSMQLRTKMSFAYYFSIWDTSQMRK